MFSLSIKLFSVENEQVSENLFLIWQKAQNKFKAKLLIIGKLI